ncbi:MAG: mechanosensitive ion channel family protein [Patescibacteria group bacterium]|nr:mechanosensitive ion channel family protein [Patescibacteria group bacterium]
MTLDHFAHHEVFAVGMVVIGALAVQVFSRNAIERLVRRAVRADRYESPVDEKKREDTVIGLFHTSFALGVWIMALMFILTILRVNPTGLLTGAGLFGVVFGFGAQNIIRNYMAGVCILTENQYRVGDIVSMSGGLLGPAVASGIVEDITLRITKLRDLDGTLHIIRNGDAGSIVNRTFKYSNVLMDVTVEYTSDIDMVEKLMNEVGTKMLENEEFNKLITTPISFLRVESFNDSGVVLKAMGKVKPGAQWSVAGEYRKQIKAAFDKHKIRLGTSATSNKP